MQPAGRLGRSAGRCVVERRRQAGCRYDLPPRHWPKVGRSHHGEIDPGGHRPVALDQEPDCRAALTIDLDVSEGWAAVEVEARRRNIASGDSDGLDGLIEGAGPDHLHLGGAMAADDAGKRPGHSIGRRFARDLQDLRHSATASTMRHLDRSGDGWQEPGPSPAEPDVPEGSTPGTIVPPSMHRCLPLEGQSFREIGSSSPGNAPSASPAAPASSPSSPIPVAWRTRSEISIISSRFSARKLLAFSLP